MPDKDLLTARLFSVIGLRNGQTIQVSLRDLNALRRNAVVHPLALLASHDDAGIAENLHVMGQGGLADAQFLQQLTGALLSASQKFQDANAVLVAERLEQDCGLSFVHNAPPIEV